MAVPKRVSAEKVLQELESGDDVLLVCAYEDDAKCRQYHVDGAITFRELQSRMPSLSKEQEIALYCA
jgi:hypothetical protein